MNFFPRFAHCLLHLGVLGIPKTLTNYLIADLATVDRQKPLETFQKRTIQFDTTLNHIPRFSRGVVREGSDTPTMVQMKGTDVLNWLKIAPFCIWNLISYDLSLIWGTIIIAILRLHAKVFNRFNIPKLFKGVRDAAHRMAYYYQRDGRNVNFPNMHAFEHHIVEDIPFLGVPIQNSGSFYESVFLILKDIQDNVVKRYKFRDTLLQHNSISRHRDTEQSRATRPTEDKPPRPDYEVVNPQKPRPITDEDRKALRDTLRVTVMDGSPLIEYKGFHLEGHIVHAKESIQLGVTRHQPDHPRFLEGMTFGVLDMKAPQSTNRGRQLSMANYQPSTTPAEGLVADL
eukprot:TRINITY_DN5992_c1_g2_i5.p1 TRINITY_DN5992_c1_g2~~TRINITY_DN5992_c1_g2_i5.p1  ORF type:complete len:343 (-),score=60.64 TRINITY_DN5992_c1_g2_i5:284-1312(-)